MTNCYKPRVRCNIVTNVTSSNTCHCYKVCQGEHLTIKVRESYPYRSPDVESFLHAGLFGFENFTLVLTRPVRLGVRTPPFHGGNTGSNPVPDTILRGGLCIKP